MTRKKALKKGKNKIIKGRSGKKTKSSLKSSPRKRKVKPKKIKSGKTSKFNKKGKKTTTKIPKKASRARKKKATKKLKKRHIKNKTKKASGKPAIKKTLRKTNTKVEKPKKEVFVRKRKRIKLKKILGDNPILRRYIIDIGGEQALAIVQALKNNRCTEDMIIKRSKAGKSDVRAALNKLHGEGLVEYVREKDENVGLYTYTWNLRTEKLVQTGKKLLLQEANTSEKTTTEKYICKACGSEEEYPFENAVDLRFKCPFCGSLLDLLEEEEEK